MTAPESTAALAAAGQESPEPSDWPLAEEALAAMPDDRRDLYAPLDIPPEPKWEPWPEYAACRAFSADEQAAEMRRWWNGLCERMYAGMRGPGGWLTGNAPDPAEREQDGTWPPPAPPGSVIVSADDVIAAVYPEPDGPGPASQEQAAEASAQGLARAGRDPDFSPPPTPGPPADAEPEPAPQPPAADGDAEQFGAPDEPFWGGSHGVVVPPETTEMTAILPAQATEEHQ